LATLGGAILTETSPLQKTEQNGERLAQTFFDVHCAHIYKIEFWYLQNFRIQKENATSSSQSLDQTVNIDLFRDIY
jgi:hypothetical protein